MSVRAAGLVLLACAALACGSGTSGTAPAPDSGSSDTRAPHASDGGTDARSGHDSGPDSRRPAEDGGWRFAPTTSVAGLTQNNTSACGSGSSPCSEAWTQSNSVMYGGGSVYSGMTKTVDGFWNTLVSSGRHDPSSANGHVSKIQMSALLPAYRVPVWVETQNWWGHGNGHVDNGENSSDAAQIANQVADHISRGVAGQIVDWYGKGTTADQALGFVMKQAETSGGKYQFAVMVDKGFFQSCGETVSCLNSGIAYLVSTYTGSPAYLKDKDGKPLVFFFVNSYYATEYGILGSSGVDPMGTSFVMYEPNGFPGSSPPNTVGEYGWVNPADGSSSTMTTGPMGTFAWASDFGLKGMTGFLQAAGSNQSSYIVSEAFKGFDDNLANWSGNRIIDQQCGLTWLETFRHTGSFAGSSSYLANLDYLTMGDRLDLVMIDTWDDYEEGTEIETGIDNCLAKLTISLAGSKLSWTPSWGVDPMNAAVMGSEATVFEYSVYMSNVGQTDLMWIADVPCSGGTCVHSLDLSGRGITGGPYVFYVQAVGQPSIVNTLAGPTAGSF